MRTFHFEQREADEPDYHFQQTFTSETPRTERPALFQADDGGFFSLFEYAVETNQSLSVEIALGTSHYRLTEVFSKEVRMA